ncbi:hypothetical protein V8E53_004546 [Lactarius tabidus]
MTINFVILRSPLFSPHDPETIIVSQELSAGPPLPEILWNFSRYNHRARITLEQNPHFYLRCPAEESAYMATFQRHPLQDTSGALEHNDTGLWQHLVVEQFFDLQSFGVLEGEQLVRGSTSTKYVRHCEQPTVYHHDSGSRSQLNHTYLRPIVTQLAHPSPDRTLEDWTVLSRSASNSIDIHIYGLRGSPRFTSSLDLPPPPPTSELPEYRVLYTTINTLEDDILLGIFNNYRLANENDLDFRFEWRKLSHVCRRWRHLIHASAIHLAMHIRCRNGTPILDTLGYLPPLPLFVDYLDQTGRDLGWVIRMGALSLVVSEEDELGVYGALRLHERVRRIDLHLLPSTLHKCFMLMDKPFPILERLSLSTITDKIIPIPTVPMTFLAPNLHHLSLLGIRLPRRLRLLSSTVSLVTLELKGIQASGYFRPRLLVARLHSLHKLEELSIGFSIPITRPSAERLLIGKQGPAVFLSNLRRLSFRGAPVLQQLDITLFNQIAFTLPHLSHFVNTTDQIKLPTAMVSFGDETSITFIHSNTGWDEPDDSDVRFAVRVICKPLDWQIDCAAQICSALMPALSGVEMLALNCKSTGWVLVPAESELQNYEIDSTTWHELLRPFIRVKELRIEQELSEQLSLALEVVDTGFEPGFLPNLQDITASHPFPLRLISPPSPTPPAFFGRRFPPPP